jgi:alkaline phosphatase D
VVSSVWQPTDTTVTTAARFAVEAGRPGISVVDERQPPVPFTAAESRYAGPDDQA